MDDTYLCCTPIEAVVDQVRKVSRGISDLIDGKGNLPLLDEINLTFLTT